MSEEKVEGVELTPNPVVATPEQLGGRISPPEWQEAVNSWINDHIRNSPIAEHTNGWNHLMSALPHLLRYVNTLTLKE